MPARRMPSRTGSLKDTVSLMENNFAQVQILTIPARKAFQSESKIDHEYDDEREVEGVPYLSWFKL